MFHPQASAIVYAENNLSDCADMLRNLLFLCAVLLATGALVTALAFHWEPDIPNSSVVLPFLVLLGSVTVVYFQRFGMVHISRLHRRLGSRLTLWLTGLITSGLMLGAGVVWGFFMRTPH